VIALGPGGRSQAPARDDRARPVIDTIVSHGLLDRLLLSPVCRTPGQADELRRALYRSARYYCSCGKHFCTRKYGNVPGTNEKNPAGGCPRGGQRIGCQADVVLWTDPADGKQKYRVQFALYDKRESMREIVRKYGADPNKWPYFSKRKRLKEGA
jgi:hypothetical protein